MHSNQKQSTQKVNTHYVSPLTMDDWNFTRNFTIKVDMSVQQPVPLGGVLTAFLVSKQKQIKELTYPNPTVGSNGNNTYITIRFDRQDIRPLLRSQRFRTHAVNAAVTFKGSFNEDVPQILDRFLEVVQQLSEWFIANCDSWTDIKGNPVPLYGAAKLSSWFVSDSTGLTQAISDWNSPEWQANRTVHLTTKLMQVMAQEEEEIDALRGESLCSLMTLDIFTRMFAAEEAALDACWSLTSSMFDRLMDSE